MFWSKKIDKRIELGVKMHGSVTVGTKGQVVIPKDVRDKLSIKSGDTLTVITKGGIAIGLIKNSDLPALLSYLQNEIHD